MLEYLRKTSRNSFLSYLLNDAKYIDNNEMWETPETIREKIKKYVDPNFEVR